MMRLSAGGKQQNPKSLIYIDGNRIEKKVIYLQNTDDGSKGGMAGYQDGWVAQGDHRDIIWWVDGLHPSREVAEPGQWQNTAGDGMVSSRPGRLGGNG